MQSFASPPPYHSRDFIEHELEEISLKNERIREELGKVRPRPTSPEIPRTVFGSAATEGPAPTVFGRQKEGVVRRFWGLEQQIREDFGEDESATTLPPQSAVSQEAIGIQTPASYETIPASYSATEGINKGPALTGLRPLHERQVPAGRAVLVFYDKQSMGSKWKGSAGGFVDWLKKNSGLFGGQDIIRHVVLTQSVNGTINSESFASNREHLLAMFPEHFPFWEAYYNHRIAFDIVFTTNLIGEVRDFLPHLLLCPCMPEPSSPISAVLTREVSVPTMFASVI